MALVLDNPSQSGGLILDDPTQVNTGALTGVLGSVAVAGFAAALSIGYVVQAQAGATGVQGFTPGLVSEYQGQGVLGSTAVEGKYSGFQAQSGGLLDGVSDPDGDPLSLEIVTVPPNGTFEWDVNGAFRFTPDTGWYGQTVGQYRIWAGGEASNIENFTIHIDKQHDGVLGSVGVQGFAGALQASLAVPGVLGSVGVQGFAGALQVGVGYEAQAQLGSVNVQGIPAALEGDFQGSLGTVSITGFTPIIDQSEVLPGVLGSVSLQGFAPALITGYQDVGVLGSVDVTGFAGSSSIATDAPGKNPSISAGGVQPNISTSATTRSLT